MKWIKTAILVCKARMNYDATLKKRVFALLSTNIENKEKKL